MKKSFLLTVLFTLFAASFLHAETKSIFHIKKLEFKDIDRWYAEYLKKNIKEAEKKGASIIIIEIDTPGGSINDALKIKNAIIDSNVPIIVYINKNAISAGALISLSAEKIYMTDGGVIGAATPIYTTGEKAGEKVVSVMRAEMRSSAERSKKSAKIAEAMVDETIVLTKEKDGIDLDDKTLLTLSADEALNLKMVDGKANGIKNILEQEEIEDYEITMIEENRYDVISKYMLHPVFLSIILSLGIFSLYMEIRTPGFGLPGAVAITCFTLYFAAQIGIGGGAWVAPLIFLLGAILILIEIFVIPGFGIVGFMGILAMIAGLIVAFDLSHITQASAVVLSAVIITTLMIFILARFLPKSTLMKKMALTEDTKDYHSSASYNELLLKEGIAYTLFRPAGMLEIDGKKYDAVSEGEFIEKGDHVKVVLVEGNRIVVKRV